MSARGKDERSMAGRIALYAVLAYLLGSFPSAYVVGYLVSGIDIRHTGNGNVGARNTAHYVGPQAGVCVALLDIAKGSIAVWLAQGAGLSRWWVLIIGAIAVLGHDFMLFLGFQGGQGMATTVGVLLVLLPVQTTVGVVAALTMRFILHIHFDLSAAIGLGAIPLLAWLTRQPIELVLYPVALLPVIGLRKLASTAAGATKREERLRSVARENGSKE
jgi:glycerol-3-phosphate acyltransferase PlsY